MDLATIVVTPEEAAAKLKEYEGMLLSERTLEDDAIQAGYRAAKRGLPVVQLTKVFEAGGWFPNGLPRLAIVRATATTCYVERDGFWRSNRKSLVFSDSPTAKNLGALVGSNTVRVPIPDDSPKQTQWRASTIVPSIPPGIRPRTRRLGGLHILWEVESWTPEPPKDPALLRHIRGDLWSVLATWDLTELERAVLSQRART